jgi:hypothetical protein
MSEHPCYTNDISAGGVNISAAISCEPGENLVLYLEEIGRLDAVVIRNHDGGFSLAIDASPYKREKIVAALTWILNRHELEKYEQRRHERFFPSSSSSAATTLIREDGTKLAATVLDLSLGGARVNVKEKLEIGEKITLGRSRGRILRIDENDVAVQFETELPSRLLRSGLL